MPHLKITVTLLSHSLEYMFLVDLCFRYPDQLVTAFIFFHGPDLQQFKEFYLVPGVLACLDGYMNIALEQTEEYVNGQLKNKYGDAFIRGNNVLYISTQKRRV
jgi:hypothetical protein